MRKRLMKFINRDLKRNNVSDLAKKIGLNVPTFWRIVSGKREGSIQTWEKIERYYR